MMTMSSKDTRHDIQDPEKAQNTGCGLFKSRILRLESWVFCFIYALSILLLFTCTVYSTTDNEQYHMFQRASAALEEILSTEEFRVQESRPSWWSRYLERFLQYLPREMGWIGNVLKWLFYLMAVFVTILVFVFMAKRLRSLPSLKIDHDIPAEPQQHLMEPETARMEAYEWSQKGDYRQAIRFLFLSLLLYLDRAALLTYDVGKTNGEYLKEVHGLVADKAESFALLILLFERRWYGTEESRAADFCQYEETFTRLTGAIGLQV